MAPAYLFKNIDRLPCFLNDLGIFGKLSSLMLAIEVIIGDLYFSHFVNKDFIILYFQL
jgi:hypothetical protein